MRSSSRLFVLTLGLLMILILAGPTAFAGTTKENQAQSSEVRKEVSEAVRAIGDYTAEQRDAAVVKAKEALAATDRHIEQLQEKIDRNWSSMSETARENARTAMHNLQQQRTELAEWYGGLKHSSTKAWEDIKQGFAKSYEALGESLEKAGEEF